MQTWEGQEGVKDNSNIPSFKQKLNGLKIFECTLVVCFLTIALSTESFLQIPLQKWVVPRTAILEIASFLVLEHVTFQTIDIVDKKRPMVTLKKN